MLILVCKQKQYQRKYNYEYCLFGFKSELQWLVNMSFIQYVQLHSTASSVGYSNAKDNKYMYSYVIPKI